MTLAIDIKRTFPDLRVFDQDDLAFVKAVLYKDDVEILEIRIKYKESHSAFVESENEYWVTSRIVSIPDLPELPMVRNEGTEVFTSKGDILKYIESMLSYARAV